MPTQNITGELCCQIDWRATSGTTQPEQMARYRHSLDGFVSTASAAAAVATDPALPEVVQLVLKLKAMEKSSAGRASGSTGSGVGLRNVVGPLKTYVAIQEKPWVLPVTVVGVVGLIFAAGYYTRKVSSK